MRFGWGQGSAPLGITFHQPGHVISNLCLNYRGKRERTKNLFDDLERDKSRIEKDFKAQFDEDFKREFGGSPELKWERRDDKQESWITVCREGVSIEDEPVKMEATRKWAINTVIALKKVLGPRLTSLLAKTS